MNQAPRISKPPLKFSDDASKLVEKVLQQSLADVIAPQYPIGFSFPDANFIALRVAPLKTYTPRFEFADDIKQQIGDLTAVGIVEVAKDPDFPGTPAVIAAGAYVVAIDLSQGNPQEAATVKGALVGDQIYPMEFTVDAQVRNPQAPPGEIPPLGVSIPANTVCYYVALDDGGLRYVASGQPQPRLSVAANFPARYDTLRRQMQELAEAANVAIISDQTISELEAPSRIETCSNAGLACGADIVIAPVKGFPAQPDGQVTAAVLQVLNALKFPDGTVVATGQYLVQYVYAGGVFRKAVLTVITDPSIEQPIPAVGAWLVSPQPDDPICAQISAPRILDFRILWEAV